MAYFYKLIAIQHTSKAVQKLDLTLIRDDLIVCLDGVEDRFDNIVEMVLNNDTVRSSYKKTVENYALINPAYPQKIHRLVSLIYSQIDQLESSVDRSNSVEKLKSMMQESRCYPDHFSTLCSLSRSIKQLSVTSQSGAVNSEIDIAKSVAKEFLIRHLMEIPDRTLAKLNVFFGKAPDNQQTHSKIAIEYELDQLFGIFAQSAQPDHYLESSPILARVAYKLASEELTDTRVGIQIFSEASPSELLQMLPLIQPDVQLEEDTYQIQNPDLTLYEIDLNDMPVRLTQIGAQKLLSALLATNASPEGTTPMQIPTDSRVASVIVDLIRDPKKRISMDEYNAICATFSETVIFGRLGLQLTMVLAAYIRFNDIPQFITHTLPTRGEKTREDFLKYYYAINPQEAESYFCDTRCPLEHRINMLRAFCNEGFPDHEPIVEKLLQSLFSENPIFYKKLPSNQRAFIFQAAQHYGRTMLKFAFQFPKFLSFCDSLNAPMLKYLATRHEKEFVAMAKQNPSRFINMVKRVNINGISLGEYLATHIGAVLIQLSDMRGFQKLLKINIRGNTTMAHYLASYFGHEFVTLARLPYFFKILELKGERNLSTARMLANINPSAFLKLADQPYFLSLLRKGRSPIAHYLAMHNGNLLVSLANYRYFKDILKMNNSRGYSVAQCLAEYNGTALMQLKDEPYFLEVLKMQGRKNGERVAHLLAKRDGGSVFLQLQTHPDFLKILKIRGKVNLERETLYKNTTKTTAHVLAEYNPDVLMALKSNAQFIKILKMKAALVNIKWLILALVTLNLTGTCRVLGSLFWQLFKRQSVGRHWAKADPTILSELNDHPDFPTIRKIMTGKSMVDSQDSSHSEPDLTNAIALNRLDIHLDLDTASLGNISLDMMEEAFQLQRVRWEPQPINIVRNRAHQDLDDISLNEAEEDFPLDQQRVRLEPQPINIVRNREHQDLDDISLNEAEEERA